MMRVTGVCAGYDPDGPNFCIYVSEAPVWTVFVEWSWGALMTALGHPCCHHWPSGRRTWTGVLCDVLPKWPRWTKRYADADTVEMDPSHAFCTLMHWHLLNNPLSHFEHSHQRNRHRIPLTHEQAEAMQPGIVADELAFWAEP